MAALGFAVAVEAVAIVVPVDGRSGGYRHFVAVLTGAALIAGEVRVHALVDAVPYKQPPEQRVGKLDLGADLRVLRRRRPRKPVDAQLAEVAGRRAVSLRRHVRSQVDQRGEFEHRSAIRAVAEHPPEDREKAVRLLQPPRHRLGFGVHGLRRLGIVAVEVVAGIARYDAIENGADLVATEEIERAEDPASRRRGASVHGGVVLARQ